MQIELTKQKIISNFYEWYSPNKRRRIQHKFSKSDYSAEKYNRGSLFDIRCVAKYRNKRKGDPLVQSKKLQKSRIVPKNSE